jgi:hypothetical protein
VGCRKILVNIEGSMMLREVNEVQSGKNFRSFGADPPSPSLEICTQRVVNELLMAEMKMRPLA